MSHQTVVEAAVRAAAGQGVEATVIVLGGNSNPEQHVTVEHEHYVHGSQTDAEAAQIIAQRDQRIAELTAALAQRDQTITEMQQAAPAPAAGGEQPAGTESIDSYSIDVLGIPEEVAKKVRKVYPTIGDLRQAAASGALKDLKLKGGQKAVIDVQERLIGKMPSSRIPAAASSGTPSGTPDLPAGHTDRPWMDRLGAVKAKERDVQQWTATMAKIRADNPDEAKMPDDAYDKLLDAQREHDIARSQVVALVWGLGLDKDHLRGGEGTVDDCLKAAGLVNLTDDPQPRVVPDQPAPAGA